MIVTQLLSAIIVLTTVLLAIALVCCAPDRKKIEVKHWAIGIAAGGLAFAGFALAEWLPGWLIYPLGNAALAMAIALCARTVLAFENTNHVTDWTLGVTIATALLILAVAHSKLLREVVESIWFAGILLYVAYRFWQAAKISRYRSFSLLVFGAAFASAAMMVRGVIDWTQYSERSGFDWHHAVTFVAAYSVAITWTIGYIMLIKDRAERRLHDMAMTDSLTGVYNRRMFFDRADRELKAAQRKGLALALLMIDLDDFKAVNDTYGHLVGDLVLQHVAKVIADCLRVEDVLARYGGEEFCVLISGIHELGARGLAERIRENIYSQPLLHESNEIRISASVGVISIGAGELRTVHQVFARADHAVYAAKREGRNRVVLESYA
ncbi:MAG: diguanylate cyclase [Casimicrobium sp.]